MHALKLTQALNARGDVCEVMTFFTQSKPREHELFIRSEPPEVSMREGVKTHILALSRWQLFLLRPLPRLLWKASRHGYAVKLVEWVVTRTFRKAFKAGNYDVIHFDGHGYDMIGFAALRAARSLGIPFLVQPTVHRGDSGHLPADRMLFRAADGMMVHTEYETRYVEEFAGISPERIHVVGNGIEDVRGGDREGFRSRYGMCGPVILFVGRKTLDKGYFILRRAFAQLREKIPDAVLVCIGPKRTDFRESVGPDLPVDAVIELDDVTDRERNDAIAGCDVVCVPGRWESFGLSLMEGALCGKRVVARNIPVLEELLGRHGAARLVGKRGADDRVELSDEELEMGLMEACRDSDENLRMSKRAVETAEDFLWAKVVERFRAAYGSHLSSSRS